MSVRVAAVDVGTNSIHLLVADVHPDGSVQTVETQRRQVALGSGALGAHRILPDAFQRGLDALTEFKAAADGLGVEDIHAAATSAVREAVNGEEFCAEVKRRTGVHVRVISGRDEARLIWLGVRPALDLSRGPALVFDVGGGSTELILGTADGPRALCSLHIGHIRLTEAAARPGKPGKSDGRSEAVTAMKRRVRPLLQGFARQIAGVPLGTVVGTSGTARCLARMATAARTGQLTDHAEGLVASRKEIERILSKLTTLPPEEILALPGMDPRRKDTLLAGAVIVREVLKAVGADALTTSERSLREGLVVDWVQRHRPEIDLSRDHAPRERSVLATMSRFGVDEPHARQVARLATTLFDGTVRVHGLSAADRELLEVAALLHDIGHHISGREHAKHGQYLLQHIRLYGFSADEVALLGNLVRWHTGGKPKRKHASVSALPRPELQRLRALAGMLQLADGLDRSHNQPLTDLRVSTHTGHLRIDATVVDGGDLEQWSVGQRQELLAESLGLEIELRFHHPRAEPVA